MALRRPITYKEAGHIELTGAYHRIREVDMTVTSDAHITGDANAPDAQEPECRISVDVFADKDVRNTMATPIAGYSYSFPLPSMGAFVDKDSLFSSAYEYIKTGEIIEFVDDEMEKLQKKIAEKFGYDLVDHKLELYCRKKNS